MHLDAPKSPVESIAHPASTQVVNIPTLNPYDRNTVLIIEMKKIGLPQFIGRHRS
jgi:hypothetical protein